MKFLAVASFGLFAALVAGCQSTPRVIPVSGNTYMITGRSYAGMFADMPALKARVIGDANEFAAAKSKVAIPVEMRESVPPHGFPSFDYTFRLADDSTTK